MRDMETQEFLLSASATAAWLETTAFPWTCLIFESMLSFNTALPCYSPNPLDLWSLLEQFPPALASKQFNIHKTPLVMIKTSDNISEKSPAFLITQSLLRREGKTSRFEHRPIQIPNIPSKYKDIGPSSRNLIFMQWQRYSRATNPESIHNPYKQSKKKKRL